MAEMSCSLANKVIVYSKSVNFLPYGAVNKYVKRKKTDNFVFVVIPPP